MLSKDKRLNLSQDFQWVVGSRIKVITRYFNLLVRFGDNPQPKIGVAIISKIFPKAVLRNQAKRKMFQAFAEIYPLLPKKVNLIALPKANINEVKSENLKQELSKILPKLVQK